MPPLITQGNDDGVVGIGAFLERVEDLAQHGVSEVNRGEVALNAFFPLAFVLNVREVVLGSDTLAGGRKVIEIVFFVSRWQFDVIEREGLEVFLGNELRLVRTVESAGEEERLVLFNRELLADPFGNTPVAAEFLDGGIERAPIGLDILPGTTAGQ